MLENQAWPVLYRWILVRCDWGHRTYDTDWVRGVGGVSKAISNDRPDEKVTGTCVSRFKIWQESVHSQTTSPTLLASAPASTAPLKATTEWGWLKFELTDFFPTLDSGSRCRRIVSLVWILHQ